MGMHQCKNSHTVKKDATFKHQVEPRIGCNDANDS